MNCGSKGGERLRGKKNFLTEKEPPPQNSQKRGGLWGFQREEKKKKSVWGREVEEREVKNLLISLKELLSRNVCKREKKRFS